MSNTNSSFKNYLTEIGFAPVQRNLDLQSWNRQQAELRNREQAAKETQAANAIGLTVGPGGFNINNVPIRPTGSTSATRPTPTTRPAPTTPSQRYQPQITNARPSVGAPQGPRPQTTSASGGIGGRVTVGRRYAATLGGRQGYVTYNAQGQRSFTPNVPATATSTPTRTSTSTSSGSPTPKPTTASQISDIQTMRAASILRQSGQSAGAARIPTSTDIRTSQTAAATARPLNVASTALQPGTPNLGGSIPRIPVPQGLGSTPIQNVSGTAFRQPLSQAPQPQSLRRPTRAPILLRQHFDPFDVVMGHLIDEGYADNEDAAVVIMSNMSEEWIQSIIQEKYI